MVIAIIAILVALLFPAFSTARRRAMTVKCVNNQRQLVAAAFSYAGEHNGLLPYSYQIIPGQSASNCTHVGLWPMYFWINNRYQYLGKLWEEKYITNPSIFICPTTSYPSFPAPVTGPSGVVAVRISYWWNPEVSAQTCDGAYYLGKAQYLDQLGDKVILTWCMLNPPPHGTNNFVVTYGNGRTAVLNSPVATTYLNANWGGITGYDFTAQRTFYSMLHN